MAPSKITIVDDVLTKGRTSVACATLLQAFYPDAKIRIFAMIRTQSFKDDIEDIVDPATGDIVSYPSGKTYRYP